MTEYLLWVDVESSGLDAQFDHLLEVAAVITNLDATEEYGVYQNTIFHSELESELIRRNAVDIVKDMHDKTGLWKRLPEGENVAVVDRELREFIAGVSPEPRKMRLAGNSVRLDLNFLEANLPETYNHLHYRSVDISALAYTLDSCWGVVDGNFHKEKKHTAIDDIRESIDEFRWLKDKVQGLAEDAWMYSTLND